MTWIISAHHRTQLGYLEELHLLYESAQCHMTGYKGRTALFETLPILERLHDKILSRASTSELRACARQEGCRTLRQAGLVAVQQGRTTVSEILTETSDEGLPAPMTRGM